MDPATERGPLIHQTHFDKVIGYVGIRHDDGAVLATAGRVGDKGWFIRPTLFTGAAPAMRVAQEKVFAAFLTRSALPIRPRRCAMPMLWLAARMGRSGPTT